MNRYNLDWTTFIVLNGPSGIGKTTLAQSLPIPKFSFGSLLREDTEKYFNLKRPDNERVPGWYNALSFKDAMIEVGSSTSLTDPYRYCRQARECFKTLKPSMVVIDDCRKLIELSTILEYGDVWFVKLTRENSQGVLSRPLDCLLDGENHLSLELSTSVDCNLAGISSLLAANPPTHLKFKD